MMKSSEKVGSTFSNWAIRVGSVVVWCMICLGWLTAGCLHHDLKQRDEPIALYLEKPASEEQEIIGVVKRWFQAQGMSIPNDIRIVDRSPVSWMIAVNPGSVNEIDIAVDPKKKVVVTAAIE